MEVIRANNIIFNKSGSSNAGTLKAEKHALYKLSKTPVDQGAQKDIHMPYPAKTPGAGSPKLQPLDNAVRAHVGPILGAGQSDMNDGGKMLQMRDTFGMPVLETPLSWKKRESPADSGIEMTPVSMSPPKVNPKIRTMYNHSRREAEEGTGDFSINPDPVPYQPSNFIPERFSKLEGSQIGTPTLSSTTMKKVPVSRRHFDSFGSYDIMAGIPKRGVMLHTDRYQLAFDGLNQRERLQAELEYMERLRGIKRRREVLPHRAQLDLLMGGKKMEFAERFEIQREIQKLKSLILPQHAKDLFHGRGFILPENHMSRKPRRLFDINYDLEDELTSPFSPERHSMNPETGRIHTKQMRQYPLDQGASLPKINNRGYLLENFRAQKGEPIQIKTPNPFSYEMEDTWTPYVTRQSTMMSPVMRMASKSPAVPFSPRRQLKPSESPDLTLYPVSQGLLMSPSPRYGTGEITMWRFTFAAYLPGSSQPAHMTRSRTNVTSGNTKTAVLGRSVTAGQVKKDIVRQSLESPAVMPHNSVTKPEIKIPVSARDPEEGDLQQVPEPTPVVPKTTPSHTTLTDKKPEVDEPIEEDQSSPTAATPNPLKGVELHRTMSEDEQNKLKQTFNKLDTDKDGHIMYSQLQTQLPKQFSQNQEKFIKQVYDITSSNTFFGVDEFMTMSFLTGVVTSLSGEPLEAYNKINFQRLHEVIRQYVELFQTVDRSHRGKIGLASLQEILNTALARDFKAEPHNWHKFIDNLQLPADELEYIPYVALIPYFETYRT
ncbi:uncharacterized protein LOC128238745 isoform X3 [Mya arenaria]|uniref:uncharacterized protein LOC128238745 isoform X3 n=1 Tax=Mya arenaria TaxID=6604 RepID=UPI0022E9235D|nr:uncharacterized protein LOC128238745 isoform X3 [Mya arenaria]